MGKDKSLGSVCGKKVPLVIYNTHSSRYTEQYLIFLDTQKTKSQNRKIRSELSEIYKLLRSSGLIRTLKNIG